MPDKFKATIKTKILSDLAEFTNASTTELEINISEGLKIQFVSISGFSGAKISLEKENIKKLQGQALFTIDTQQFSTIIKTFSDENTTLEVMDSRLYLSNKTQECYLNLICSSDSEKNIKIKELPVYLKVNSEDILSFIKDSSKLGNFISFRFDGDKKELTLSIKTINMGFKKEIEVTKGKGVSGTSTYQLEFLKELLTNAEGELEIELGNGMPIKLNFKIGDLSINSFIAPRISED